MTFVSVDFLVFFLIVFSLRWLLPSRWRNLLLLAASYWFYSSWDRKFLFLLLSVTAISYFCALAIGRHGKSRMRRRYAALAVVSHVGLLALFKYRGFFQPAALGWALPLGLSYYTFQSLGYVLDVYRGQTPERNIVNYGLFVSFFPQLIAGPIARAQNLLPQLSVPQAFRLRQFQEGCWLVFWGLFQKIVVADNLAPFADSVFKDNFSGSGSTALLGLYAFAFQILADFSGYSDMARGLGKCLGLELALNFNLPIFAVDIHDFWKRWHMSLSNWLADFVYRPLLSCRYGYLKLYTAPVITMMIVGLWHGAKWTFILMGLLYGALISATLFVKARTRPRTEPWAVFVSPWFGRLATFHLALAGGLLLRADSLTQAGSLLSRIVFHFSLPPEALAMAPWLLFFATPLILIQCLQYAKQDHCAVLDLPPAFAVLVYVGLLCLILVFGNLNNPRFFYLAY